MAKTLLLLDGMALIYRAHFAFIRRPIMTSKGANTSALYGFTNYLLDLIQTYAPTHLAVVFDTEAPTARHREYPEYKAHREAMPEDIEFALPHARRLLEAFRIPVLTLDGYEADDIIGTLARKAEKAGYQTYLVTPDKDFGQLVDEQTWILKPGRAGEPAELMKREEVLQKWGVDRPEQVVDVLGLMGDSSDNIPGVPGIGEKTAAKLIRQFGSVEGLLAGMASLQGKVRETLEAHRTQAELSKRLATIDCDVPIDVSLEALAVKERDETGLKRFFVEFEFNTLGRRLFGEDFKAGRGFGAVGQGELGLGMPKSGPGAAKKGRHGEADAKSRQRAEAKVTPAPDAGDAESVGVAEVSGLRTIQEVRHEYRVADTPEKRSALMAELRGKKSFCFDTETTGLDPKEARLLGVAFCWEAHRAWYLTLPQDPDLASAVLKDLGSLLGDESVEKVGHNLKYDLGVLRWHGVVVKGPMFDTMLAHSLIEPDQRHGMDYLSELYLGYTPIPITALIGDKKNAVRTMDEVPLEALVEYAAEDADVTWQLRARLERLLKEKGQEKVFYEIESPLIRVLVDMEYEGVRVDARALGEFAGHLAVRMKEYERDIHKLAGRPFNLNSPKQLGEVLFEGLKIGGQAKRTRTGQYATDEQTLLGLSGEHEIVRLILEYRTAAKLKSTYADTLPGAIFPRTGRVHTTFNQAMTATGRLQSQDPNLQNIPIRTDLGQEIRKAFVPRGRDYRLLSADYSQIELRIIAALSGDRGMLEAFEKEQDIHAATGARLYGVALADVTAEMRRQAKMVNFGIIYGISAFGLAQRLGIPRQAAAAMIEQYFRQYPGIQKYIQDTLEGARRRGYVETITGRRRYVRDINSANATQRGAAERTAINAPVQGSAADMIKSAMGGIHQELASGPFRTKMVLQVHDELVFDLYAPEEEKVRSLVEKRMKTALVLPVPIVVDMGVGGNWLEAH